MPIASTDLLYKLSTTAGSAGNSNTSTPAGSLGKYISTTLFVDSTLEDLFNNIDAAEASAGGTEYRCLFLHNNHATLTLTGAKVYISSQVAGGADCAIGADPAGVTDIGSAGDQAATIAAETDAPAGVSFSTPADFASGLSLGDIGPGQCAAFWVKRVTAAATAAIASDGITWAVQGTTAP